MGTCAAAGEIGVQAGLSMGESLEGCNRHGCQCGALTSTHYRCPLVKDWFELRHCVLKVAGEQQDIGKLSRGTGKVPEPDNLGRSAIDKRIVSQR